MLAQQDHLVDVVVLQNLALKLGHILEHAVVFAIGLVRVDQRNGAVSAVAQDEVAQRRIADHLIKTFELRRPARCQLLGRAWL